VNFKKKIGLLSVPLAGIVYTLREAVLAATHFRYKTWLVMAHASSCCIANVILVLYHLLVFIISFVFCFLGVSLLVTKFQLFVLLISLH